MSSNVLWAGRPMPGTGSSLFLVFGVFTAIGGRVPGGLILVAVGLLLWYAREVTVYADRVRLKSLTGSRDLRADAIETVELGMSVLGKAVRVTGRGGTKTTLGVFTNPGALEAAIWAAIKGAGA